MPSDTPLLDSAQPDAAPLPDDGGSLADHEARYNGSKPVEAQTEPETPPAEVPEPESAPDQTEPVADRDEKGRFTPKKERHRAASQQATPDDVPRIRELTARLRAAEAERDALKVAGNGHRPTPAAAAPVPAAPTPKPTPDQFQDYGEYIEALTDWKTDQKLAAAEQKRQQAEQQRAAEAEFQRLHTSWEQRKQAARTKYPDFDAVALEASTAIPPGSLVDGWILEHKAGADVLYHFQKHPDELSDLLALPLFDQADALALLSQRLTGQASRSQAAPTGSAAAPVSPPAPRPPNPVRTGPIRAGDEPPGDDASLADHERFYPVRRARGA